MRKFNNLRLIFGSAFFNYSTTVIKRNKKNINFSINLQTFYFNNSRCNFSNVVGSTIDNWDNIFRFSSMFAFFIL